MGSREPYHQRWPGCVGSRGYTSTTTASKGPISREIGKLSELTDLYLDVNHLTGPVPVEIAAIVNLQGEALSFSCLLPLVSWVKSSRKDNFLIFFSF